MMINSNFIPIKDKKYQKEYGEVFTDISIVEKLFSLQGDDWKKHDYKILDNSAGDGSFLRYALTNKLNKIKKFNSKEFRKMFIILSSIYGIELQKRNVEKLKDNLLNIFLKRFKQLSKNQISDQTIELARNIIANNIVQGDSIKFLDENEKKLIFKELVFDRYIFWFTSYFIENFKSIKITKETYNLLDFWRYYEK